MSKEVIAIFDLGKTNKKFVLYDEKLNPVYKSSLQLPETVDEDLFPCEDYILLKDWMLSSFAEELHKSKYKIKGLNFSAYGATLVHLGYDNQPITPIYNYLKPYDKQLQQFLYQKYGGRTIFCSETASPPLGHLNSGLTLFWLQQQHKKIYNNIKCSLHLPEFCSFLFSDDLHSGITSVGCHTHMWDFGKQDYHCWVKEQGLCDKIAPFRPSGYTIQKQFNGFNIFVGMGLHDSSSALIPHLKREKHPFALLSTGTWCITMNPYNQEPLTVQELEADCLCYMSYTGTPVKAARYFAGKIHEDMVNGLCKVYHKKPEFFYNLSFDEGFFLMAEDAFDFSDAVSYYSLPSAAQAYHHFMYSLVRRLLPSIQLAIGNTNVCRLIVEGGFSRNNIFIKLLNRLLPGFELLTSGDEEASALGAAMLLCENLQKKKVFVS